MELPVPLPAPGDVRPRDGYSLSIRPTGLPMLSIARWSGELEVMLTELPAFSIAVAGSDGVPVYELRLGSSSRGPTLKRARIPYRSTVIGSTRDARRTGPSSAIDAHTSSSSTAAPSVTGSNGVTP